MLAHGVIHADEAPIQMLTPGVPKTRRAYVWAYATRQCAGLTAVVYDFSPSRAGEHARTFLGDRNGKLVCDHFAGYKAGFEQGITEIGCMTHARRKFFDLHAEKALHYIAALYEVEREVRLAGTGCSASNTAGRSSSRHRCAPHLDDRPIAKALDYSLKRWIALTR
ncbi:transposase [Pseudomonas rhodesiae]|uniref:IS66 family transposase n=1 Tax=Pseudomonas rhodesiae TaxID=76760 RepID=UPI000B8BEA52|nr:transposase [Pseudomonas rhodesiae]OXS21019.1 hypothetical protein CGU36_16745 [Pseudomonas fluorescens]OZO47983.1 hypothetical protein CGU37_15785 [Pseudomonas fluorescens]QVM99607.1 transposase [Pseudomonas rhodesiae]TGY17428.1 hypothetical protein E5845_15490 [Pseudomonas fluorescens]